MKDKIKCINCRRIIPVVLFLFAGILLERAIAQSEFNALSWSNKTAYNAYLMHEVHWQNKQRRQAFDVALASKQSMYDYIDACRNRYKNIAGQFPEKQELRPHIVGKLQVDGYSVEKIVFQSIQGRYVTANLYMPEGYKKPVPAALALCGHGLTGKAPLKDDAALMATNGIAVLVVDPLGQGERLQLIDKEGKPLTRGATTEHTLLNAGLNLLGTSLAAQEFWDNHRALDYLISRDDIDSERIGIYGSSGGGTQTAYYVGLDERVKVAAICSYFSSRERTLELMGPSDGCQHIPCEGREKLELTDFALMMAPKPLLILSGKYDFVDLWGAEQGFEELKQAYSMLGVADKADMLTVEDGHGLQREKQYKLVSWFMKWLCNTEEVLKIPVKAEFKTEDFLCSSAGQVNISYPDAVSLMDENRTQFEALNKQRRQIQHEGVAAMRKQVLSILGKVIPEAELHVEQTVYLEGRGYEQYNFQLIREGEMPLPCVLVVPETANEKSSVHICLMEEGKAAFLNEFTNIGMSLTDGTILLVADLRGIGETADPPLYNDSKYWNFEYRNAMTSMHIGRPILGQRVTDVITLLDFCNGHKELKGHPVHIRATGLYGPVVIHAAFLDERIGSVDITKSIKSWQSYLTVPLQRDMYSNVLYGALQYYDLPDLIRMTERPVRITD
jgi:dienelactone hydrolase